MIELYRGVAQLVARLVRVQEAVGSTPATPTIGVSVRVLRFFYYFFVNILFFVYENVHVFAFGSLYVEPHFYI